MSEVDAIIELDEESNTTDRASSASPNSAKAKRARLTFPFGACRVCSDSATGIHYGIATCEGCKGFFKRSILRKEKYRCYFDNTCLINVTNRNRCKACRFRRCINEGMSVDGVKMGRIPKLVKERALKELKEQQMKGETAGVHDSHPRTASCSSGSDRSVENYDPNAMETDFLDRQPSAVQRATELTAKCTNESRSKPISKANSESKSVRLTYRTKYPTYLPDDFGADEAGGLIDQLIGFLKSDSLQTMKSLARKCQMNSYCDLNDAETTFIRYLCWCSHNIYLRRSRCVKQLVSRMNQMIENDVREYPGDQATFGNFCESIRLTCEVYTPAVVKYLQELPGFRNLQIDSLQQLIAQGVFDFYLIKYHELYNDNGQSYFLAPDGFQHTRDWMVQFQGQELTDQMFHFAQCLRQLQLSESEFSLLVPLQICSHDSSIEDRELVQMLHSCYFRALYLELCHNRGDSQGKLMCNRILQTLDLLTPIVTLYKRDVASRLLEG